MPIKNPASLITLIFTLCACSSQPLSPEDEMAMELYRGCMEGAPSTWSAADTSTAVSQTGVNSAGAINSSAEDSRDLRHDQKCKDLARERSD